MRRHPFSFRAVLAVAVFWLAANVVTRGAPSDVGGTIGSVHGETMALWSSHARIDSASAPRKAPPSERWSRLFLASRSVAVRDAGVTPPRASASSRIHERERLTFTYDATAPPGEIQNTVC